MKDSINLPAYINKNVIQYENPNYVDIINAFKTQHDGEYIEVTFSVKSGVFYFQHKYYRGYLLPSIAEAYGEKDLDKVHISLKRSYLFQECKHINEIPKKHFKKGYIVISADALRNMDFGHLTWQYITGVIIVHDNDVIIGYIPSTSSIKSEEMRGYILKCENRLFSDLGGHIIKEFQEEAQGYRTMAFNGDLMHAEIK
jgi:hypothetical protein